MMDGGGLGPRPLSPSKSGPDLLYLQVYVDECDNAYFAEDLCYCDSSISLYLNIFFNKCLP